MNIGQVDYTVRAALKIFDEWNDIAGIFTPGEGYYNEIINVIEEAVHCGIQMALQDMINIIDDGEDITDDPPP